MKIPIIVVNEALLEAIFQALISQRTEHNHIHLQKRAVAPTVLPPLALSNDEVRWCSRLSKGFIQLIIPIMAPTLSIWGVL
ncbi:MAG: hypothetical protein QM520_04625 [Gammaproteobacteria bacterium]|nr:hypothetical protein [Gammaproteobacteria bacterium]